ncbi:MerR family transcriptional regulator [Mycetohabitans sp. B8]|uniref:MerR family transcriptional regulator n=1 Tax=Mycetohabitans sp. B8 TaxID=2841845 RepID=UPI001F207249|nr:MerR family transcriptional regulator [Mycetohabitans sp. B8]MCG1043495.1 MerR family transcriptional regulator [Mycetohabitans sp. B8]
MAKHISADGQTADAADFGPAHVDGADGRMHEDDTGVPKPSPSPVGIGALAHEIGLTRDTLRVWERRYGFPRPLRNTGGERLYPAEQVRKLRLVKQLLDVGHRPGNVLPHPEPVLREMVRQSTPVSRHVDLAPLLELIDTERWTALRDELMWRLARVGIERFIDEIAIPLGARVGHASVGGSPRATHAPALGQVLQDVFRRAVRLLTDGARGRPCALLAAVPGAAHDVQLAMMEVLFVLARCRCAVMSAGVSLDEIADAARASDVDMVVLSMAAAPDAASAARAADELQTRLPPQVQLWTCGGNVPRRLARQGIQHLVSMTHIDGAVAQWRRHRVLL